MLLVPTLYRVGLNGFVLNFTLKNRDIMNKSLLTNIISAGILAIGLMLGKTQLANVLTMLGLFSLSGAITNWLAVYMLFERVPFLYGSGVIPAHFEEFKEGIRVLIMEQFFTVENIERVLSTQGISTEHINLEPIINQVDFSPAYEGLIEEIMKSQFGTMLGMFGGVEALTPLREPLIKRLKSSTIEMTQNEHFNQLINESLNNNDDMSVLLESKVKVLIEQRLEELTPQLVKEIIQKMIRKHLGWLVVWGGVLGGLIGIVTAYITTL